MRPSTVHLRGFLPAVVALVAAVLPARAQGRLPGAVAAPVASASAGVTGVATARTADELFRRAGEAYDVADFKLAHALYSEAFEKKKTHDIAAMLAQTEIKLGKLCEADGHLDFAVESFPPSLSDERRERIERARTGVKKQIGSLRVELTPKDATAQIDYRAVAARDLPGPLCVPAGERVLFVSHDGFAVERRTVSVEAGVAQTVVVELRRVAVEVMAPLPPPRHFDRAPPSGDPWKPAGFGMFATGIVGVVAGAVLLPFAAAKKSEADGVANAIQAKSGGCPDPKNLSEPSDFRPDCQHLHGLRSDSATFGNVGVTALIAGVVLGTVGGVVLFRSRPGSPPPVALDVRPNGAHLTLTGSF